jgi:hypothetical protein
MNMPQDIIGHIDSLVIEKYAVLQVNDGAGWLDFCTIKDPDDVPIAARMVRNRGGINGHRTADYRIWQNGKPVYTLDQSNIEFGGVNFRLGDRLQVFRLDDVEDIETGWTTARMICTIEDARIAVERCNRLRMPDDKRHHRVVSNDGFIRLSQSTLDSLRLSGILWQADPLKFSCVEDVVTNRYDRYSARMLEGGVEWDSQIVLVLNELNADQDLRDRVLAFLALAL